MSVSDTEFRIFTDDELLDLCTHENFRARDRATVDSYKEMMLRGDWIHKHPQPIVLHPIDYHLDDGQHRLKAEVEARMIDPKIKINWRVCTFDVRQSVGNSPSGSQVHWPLVDTLRPRTLEQYLKHIEYYRSGVAGLIKFAYAVERGQTLQLALRQPLMADVAQHGRFAMRNWTMLKSSLRLGRSLTKLGCGQEAGKLFWLYLRDGGSVDDVELFCQKMREGDEELDSPITKGRRWFANLASKKTGSIRIDYRYGILVKVWNAWVMGLPIQSLAFRSREKFILPRMR